jgi:hypothetical protein
MDSYNTVSDALNEVLHLDRRIWELARPGGIIPSEQMITDALADVIRVHPGEDTTTALLLQQALLARCPSPVKEYYRVRPMQVVLVPRGRLGPDLVLDGRNYHPDRPIPNVFVVEVKYLADWQVPYAGTLFGRPTDYNRYDPVALWGIGHDDPAGLRIPHYYGTRADCEEFYHNHVGGGLYVASAVQIDIYVAYAALVLRDLGVVDTYGAPRVWGLLVDAWARHIEADLAITWRRWTTVSFADLLAEAYEALKICNAGSAAADRLEVLLARLLWL